MGTNGKKEARKSLIEFQHLQVIPSEQQKKHEWDRRTSNDLPDQISQKNSALICILIFPSEFFFSFDNLSLSRQKLTS
jgi:hypothetical protein